MRPQLLRWPVLALVMAACAVNDDAVVETSRASDPTVASTTTSPPGSSTTTSTTTTTTTTAAPATIVDWLEQERELGFNQVILAPSWGTGDPVIVTAYTQTPRIEGDLAIALGDGRVAPLPESITSQFPTEARSAPNLRLSRLNESPLVVYIDDDGRTVTASRLDPETLRWTDIEGLTPLELGERLDVWTAGAYTLLVHSDDTVVDMYRQWGEMISPVGAVIRMAEAPTDTPMWFTNDAGGKALLLGLDTVAGESPDLPAPVAFDPRTNAWTVIPTPDWIECEPRCFWGDRHEGPDAQFFRTTPAGVVAYLPGGSYGLLEPIGMSWRPYDEPPIPLPGPIAVPVGVDRLLVVPGPAYDNTQAIGTAVWLDLATGTWTTQQIIDPAGQVPPVWWETRWWGDTLLLGVDGDEVVNPPLVAIDLTTGEVRAPSEEELAVWPTLVSQPAIEDLIDAWQRRI
jgi:hypothetical protein